MSHETYLALRQQVLALRPDELGVAPTEQLPTLYGVVMESGLDRGSYTLVVLADGTTSLYFSSGGGMLGTGTRPAVREMSDMFLGYTQRFVDSPALSQATSTPLPGSDQVRIYLLVRGAPLRVVDAPVAVLRDGPHAFHPVFRAAHEVIASIRRLSKPAGSGEYMNYLLTALAEARIDRPILVPYVGTLPSLEPFAQSDRLREWLGELNFDYAQLDANEVCEQLMELSGVSRLNPFKKKGGMTVARITESGEQVDTRFRVERSKGSDGRVCLVVRWVPADSSG